MKVYFGKADGALWTGEFGIIRLVLSTEKYAVTVPTHALLQGPNDRSVFFLSSRSRHTIFDCDWSSDVCSSDLNVSPFASFRDATYEDFLASGAAIGPALVAAGERSLGATIRAGVEATARWAPSNTNLGLVLLLAPLARAALRPGDKPLRAQVTATLAATTVADARDVYVAIRSAAPGGLGRASEQDVAGTPTATLREAMVLARDRDAIAREIGRAHV